MHIIVSSLYLCMHSVKSATPPPPPTHTPTHTHTRTHHSANTPASLQANQPTFYNWTNCRANSLYEGTYLLGTSIARPLIAKRQIEIAKMVGVWNLNLN